MEKQILEILLFIWFLHLLSKVRNSSNYLALQNNKIITLDLLSTSLKTLLLLMNNVAI